MVYSYYVTNIADHKWVCAHFFYCNILGSNKVIGGGIISKMIIRELAGSIEERLNSSGIELVDIQYHKENKEQILRIIIDSVAGVSLELCSEATRLVKDIIDGNNIYYDHLEVSSPGLDRVLKNDKDFVRFTGYKVRAKTLKVYDGARKITGILKGFDDQQVVIEVEDGVTSIPRDMITVIRLDPEF